jgi:hypothetical protein
VAGAISENYLSRPFSIGSQAGRELVFDITGTDDEEEVEAMIEGAAPAVYLYRILDSISAEPVGSGVWKGYARYVRFETDDEYTFDTAGGTQKITQSITTVASYAPAGQSPPDFEGAIGVTEDRVEGVDVPVPQFQFTETHRFADSAVDQSYKIALAGLTGRYNVAAFRGFAAGEVMFMGASGSKRGDETWSITFRFSVSPNATGLAVGSITGIDKLGWDYLWVRYGDHADATAKALVKRPVAAYVEQVSYPGDFDGLGIG